MTQDTKYLASFTIAAERIAKEKAIFKDLISDDPVLKAEGLAGICAAIVMATGEAAEDFERKGVDVLRAKNRVVAKIEALAGRLVDKAA